MHHIMEMNSEKKMNNITSDRCLLSAEHLIEIGRIVRSIDQLN